VSASLASAAGGCGKIVQVVSACFVYAAMQLAGIAGLVAGALSMAAGEWVRDVYMDLSSVPAVCQ
jgi:VIT1/CCC1 family predicted Fe2+/Mn2+ transporter